MIHGVFDPPGRGGGLGVRLEELMENKAVNETMLTCVFDILLQAKKWAKYTLINSPGGRRSRKKSRRTRRRSSWTQSSRKVLKGFFIKGWNLKQVIQTFNLKKFSYALVMSKMKVLRKI